MRRFASFVLLCLLLIPAAARANDQVAMVQGQIQMAQERLAAYQGELSSTLSLLQKSPNDATFQKIRDLQDKIRRQGNVVDTLRMALQDARVAKAVIETINPMAEPTGRRDLKPLEIIWKSRPLTDLRLGMSRAGTATQFDFRLYELDVQVKRDGVAVRDFNVRKTGWVAARPIMMDED